MAAHLPICWVCMVSSADDPRLVVWHVPMVSRSNYVEVLPSSHHRRHWTYVKSFDGCGADCAMSAIGRPGTGRHGVKCASLA